MVRYTIMALAIAGTIFSASLQPSLTQSAATAAAIEEPAASEPPSEPAASELPSEPAASKSPPGPAVVTVKKRRVRDVIELKGVFAAAETKEISLPLRVWSELRVVRVVPHGERVQRGARLLSIDTEKIDRAIRETSIDVHLSELALQQAKRALRLQEREMMLDVAAARRSKRSAGEDLTRFLTVERPQLESDAEYSVKSSEDMLSYAQEELHQLEQMYEADDLTEESEEIILKRQRDTVERAARAVRLAKLSRDRALALAIPRQEEDYQETLRRRAVTLDKALATLPVGMEKARLELDKAQIAHKMAVARLQQLRKDRKQLDVRAPMEGVVYYGRSTQGNWPAVSALEAKLCQGGTIRPDDVFMTIVGTPATGIMVTIEEEAIGRIRVGLNGTARPTGYSAVKLPVQVTAVSLVPLAPGKFSGRLAIKGETARAIMPGMTCQVELEVKNLPDALTVPASGVFSENDEHFVYVAGGEGKHEKRSFKGVQVGALFVVRRGLEAGTRVLTERPEEEP